MVMIRNMLIMSDMGRPSSFTKDQMVNIVLWWGELQNVFKVRRKYAKHYGIDRHPREVPAIRSFKTVIDKFSKTGSTLPMKDPGPQKTARTEENISRVRTVIQENKQQFMMPIIQATDDYEDLWMQQDGARSHTAEKVRDWLTATFGDQVISGKMEIAWPASSPDLTCPDYWLWGVCLQEIRRVKPATLEELKEIVDDFCESLDPEEIRRAVANVRKRAAACIECGGGHFEHLLKRARKDTAEE